MLNLRTLQNQKNITVLSSSDLARVRRSAQAPVEDRSVQDEKTRALATHEKTLAVTETWGNSIVNQRKARLNRLQKEKEDHEEELKKIDEQEKQIQESQRRDQLLQSAEMAFQEKPEIRAVNAQLLLHEVVKQRQRQIQIKERQKALEKQKEEEYYQEQKRQWQEYDEKEKEAARLKREKALKTAADFKKQREEAQERKLQERCTEVEEEAILQKESKRLLDEETMQTIKMKQMERQRNIDNLNNNISLHAYKEKEKELERLEEQRIRELQIKVMDDLDQREAEEKARRKERQARIDKLIELQTQNLMNEQSKKQAFDDSQYMLQFEKDRKEVEEIRAKQERLIEERKRDFLESQKKLEAKRNAKKVKHQFPPDEATMQLEDRAYTLEVQKLNGLKDLAEFQKQQAQEKKEREAAEKERERLEYQKMLQDEEMRTLEAQEYARQMLLQARRARKK